MKDCVVRWGEFRQAPRLLFSAKSNVSLKILMRLGHIQFWNFGHQFGSGCWPACTARVPLPWASSLPRRCWEALWCVEGTALEPGRPGPRPCRLSRQTRGRRVLSLRLQVFSGKTGRPTGRESECEGRGLWWDVRRSGPWRPQPQPDESEVSTKFTEQNSQRGHSFSRPCS